MKELVYFVTVICGKPVEFRRKCVNMVDYGSNAAKLKRAFDDVFMGSGIDEERFKRLLVSNGADGSSVNTRRYNGACTWMKTENERNWQIIMHCSNHLVHVSRIISVEL